MNNKAIIMLTIISILFITGCTQTYSNIKYNTGTEGIVLELSEANPEKIYEEEEFGNTIIINNKGAHSVDYINPARLIISYDTYRLRNLDLRDSDGQITLENIALEGKNKEFPVGEDYPFSLYFMSNTLTHLRESSITEINYNLCYPYVTELTTMTCIDTTAVTRSKTVSACEVEEYNGGSGQGAPIVITKIVPEILMQQNYARPQFKIYIENQGGGYVTNTYSCADMDIKDTTSSGKVNVRAWLSNKETGRELQCGPVQNNGILRLTDSESYIRCYLPQNVEGYDLTKRSYVTPLIIEVDYTYLAIEKQEVEILRNDLLEQPVTQGTCASYQVDYQGKCVTKCEYCAKNPDAFLCQENEPYAGFRFGETFSCSCTKQVCDEKASRGSCIIGYCPGNLYCCSTNQCDTNQVEYNGECIDKCEYCSLYNTSDTIVCGAKDLSGFSCESMTESTCEIYSQQGYCIKGMCGGTNINKYCANSKGFTQMRQAMEIYAEKGVNLCGYCASINGASTLCSFMNKGITAEINSGFGCYCTANDLTRYQNAYIDPEQAHCYNDPISPSNYCCNTQMDPGY